MVTVSADISGGVACKGLFKVPGMGKLLDFEGEGNSLQFFCSFEHFCGRLVVIFGGVIRL
jgi:hypothetical protein